MDLELVGTQDLIDELFRRKTFAGVLIYSKDSAKFENQFHEDVCMVTSVDKGTTITLLHSAAEEADAQMS